LGTPAIGEQVNVICIAVGVTAEGLRRDEKLRRENGERDADERRG